MYPPGNKQVGEHVAVVITSPISSKNGLVNYTTATNAVVKDLNNTIQQKGVKCVQLGEFSTIGIATPIKNVAS